MALIGIRKVTVSARVVAVPLTVGSSEELA